MKTTVISADDLKAVSDIVNSHNRDAGKLIAILQAVQAHYRYLPEEVMMFLASALRIPAARIYGVATFYSHFALEPRGRYVIRVCDGTACHVKKSTGILDAIRKALGLSPDAGTTPDMMFTLETVSCLGACGLAPAMVVNDDVHGQVTPAKALQVIGDVSKKEKQSVG